MVYHQTRRHWKSWLNWQNREGYQFFISIHKILLFLILDKLLSADYFVVKTTFLQVEVFAKIFYGDPTKKLCESVDLVPLSCLVIGSRGLSTLKRYACAFCFQVLKLPAPVL
jgi:hypothetical protein